jgi:hypothetical protein
MKIRKASSCSKRIKKILAEEWIERGDEASAFTLVLLSVKLKSSEFIN